MAAASEERLCLGQKWNRRTASSAPSFRCRGGGGVSWRGGIKANAFFGFGAVLVMVVAMWTTRLSTAVFRPELSTVLETSHPGCAMPVFLSGRVSDDWDETWQRGILGTLYGNACGVEAPKATEANPAMITPPAAWVERIAEVGAQRIRDEKKNAGHFRRLFRGKTLPCTTDKFVALMVDAYILWLFGRGIAIPNFNAVVPPLKSLFKGAIQYQLAGSIRRKLGSVRWRLVRALKHADCESEQLPAPLRNLVKGVTMWRELQDVVCWQLEREKDLYHLGSAFNRNARGLLTSFKKGSEETLEILERAGKLDCLQADDS